MYQPGPNTSELWNESVAQVAKGRPRGPYEYTSRGGRTLGGKAAVANPAYRFGAQQPYKLRTVDDLKRSLTNGATAVQAPINLP